MSSDCSICTERLNKAQRKRITCPYCEDICCLSCVREYLLGLSSDMSKCVFCAKEWSLEFLSKITPKTFHNNKHRDHRVKFYLETEKSLLPATHVLVERTKTERTVKVEIN
jgi:hypothetical protein